MPLAFSISPADASKRLDHFLKDNLPQYSRAQIQQWIKQHAVLLNNAPAKPSAELRPGDTISVQPIERPPLKATPEDLPLTVLYQDPSVIAIDKPAGMVVHAGAGVHSGTLTNALLHHFQQLSSTAGELRPGIVHRLDKDTSGVILIARNDAAHHHLSHQFASRQVEKIYLALVQGRLPSDSGTITKPIARDPNTRVKMTTRLSAGRSAITSYRVLQRFPSATFLEVKIGTGRTHQIRVHLASIGHPVVNDTLYGAAANPHLDRFFLHAHRITFASPSTALPVTVESPLPPALERHLHRNL